MNAKAIKVPFDEHNKLSSRLIKGLEKVETPVRPFREIYCIKQPR